MLGDTLFGDNDDIKQHIVRYFQSIYSSDNNCSSNEEIRKTVFSMDSSGAPGPDGFGGCFYQRCWDIVWFDVVKAVQSFFLTGYILPNLNSHFITLVPRGYFY